MRSLPTFVIATVLGLTGTAHAAGWSGPVTVSAPHTFAQPVSLVQSSQSVLAIWGWQDVAGLDAPGGDEPGGISSAQAPFGSGFSAESPGPSGIVDTAPYGPRRAVAVTQTDVRGKGPTNSVVGVAFSENGRFGSLHRLITAPVRSRASIASNGGVVIVCWVETADRRRVVKVVTRSPGGVFSPPSILSGVGQADLVDVAANRRGDLALLFVRNGKVVARVRRAGQVWGPIRELTRAEGATKWQLTSAISESGRVVVAWRRYRLRHDGIAGTRALESAYMAAGKSTFSVPQVVEADGVVAPALLARPSSTAFALAWTDQDGIASGGPAMAKVALTGDGPRFGAPLAASSPAGGLRDVRIASGPSGLYAVWVEPQAGGNSDGVGRGALLPTGASAFLAPEQITPSENVHEVAIAADVTGDAFVAVWSARPEGTGPGIPVAELRSVVRAARRVR